MAATSTGGTDYLRRTTDLPNIDQMSISFWFRLDSDLNTFCPVWMLNWGSGTVNEDYIQFGTDSTGTQLVYEDKRNSSGVYRSFNMANMTVGTWYFIAGYSDCTGGTSRGYWAAATAAGLSTGSVGGNAAHNKTSQSMSFLADNLFNQRIEGTVAAVKIWDGVLLSQAEFEAERWFYSPQRTANLHTWSPLIDTGGSTWNDYSGNGRNWTEGGTVNFTDGPPIAWAPLDNTRIYIPGAGGGGTTFTLTADGGTYAITGTASGLYAARKVAAAAGSYAVSGTNAALKASRSVVAVPGSYSVTGTSASLLAARKLAAGEGSYAVTGTDAVLRRGWRLVADAGSYAISGTAAALKAARKLVAAVGSYLLTGSDAALEAEIAFVPVSIVERTVACTNQYYGEVEAQTSVASTVAVQRTLAYTTEIE